MERTDRPRTVQQAAAELNLSHRTLGGWISQRRIGVLRLGRCVRVPAAEIQRLLDASYEPAERR